MSDVMQNILGFFFTPFKGSRRDTKINRKKKFVYYFEFFAEWCHFPLILACARHWKSSPVFDT